MKLEEQQLNNINAYLKINIVKNVLVGRFLVLKFYTKEKPKIR